MPASHQEAIVFDLAESASNVYNPTIRNGALLFGVMLTLLDMYAAAKLFYDDLIPGSRILIFQFWTVAFIAGMAVMGYWAYFFWLAPAASRIQLGPQGVILVFASGKVFSKSWTDPALKLRILDRSQNNTFYWPYKLTIFACPPTALTRESFDALVRSAGTANFHIRQSSVNTKRGPGVLTTISH